MSEERLRDLLARAIPEAPEVQVPVNPPLRARRRGTPLLVAVSVALTVIVLGSMTLLGGDEPSSPGARSIPTSTDPTPDGTRLVGIAESAIAVPEGWATNALRCGTATEPTVVVDVASVPLCDWQSPKVHDNVWIEQGVNKQMFSPTAEFEIDDVPAERDRPRCRVLGNETTVCTGTVHLPTMGASYRAEASSARRVAEILSWIRIMPDHVAVPGFERLSMKHQGDDAAGHYRARLEAQGLQVETVVSARPRLEAGRVVAVDPPVGSMLSPGDVVTVWVSR